MKREKRKAMYMLRYALQPWNAEKRGEELARYCMKTGIDEVIFFTMGAKNFMELETDEESKAYAQVLRPVMQRLRGERIETSINVLCTVGHGDLGRDLSSKFPFQFQVDADGTESKACACPLDAEWGAYVAELYRTYASLKPRIIWVDDDFRLHNHGNVKWGCFCPLHLNAFSERIGRMMSRQEIVKAVLAPDSQPSEERLSWLGLMGDTMIKAALILERAVHEISPETRLGLMTSTPEVHSLEGRRWHELLEALSGPYDAVVRPTLGNYTEGDKRDLLYGLTLTLHTKALVPRKALICPEVENYPYTRFSKSAKFTSLQIALCQLCGIPDITLNLYDFFGGPLLEEPAYGKMLQDDRPFFDSIASLISEGGVTRGIRLFYHEQGAAFRLTDGVHWDGLLARRPWDFTLPLLGFATTYGESPIYAVSGDSVSALKDEALHDLLRMGLLLDSSAAASLHRRGMTEFIGVAVGERTSNCFLEEILDEDFGRRKDEPHTFLPAPTLGTLHPTQLRRLEPLHGAKVISQMLGDDGEVLSSGLTLFENRLGGRIAVLAYDGQPGEIDHTYFRNWTRKSQLQATVSWLGRGAIPFLVEGAADVIPIRIDQPGRLILGIANLSSDPITLVRGLIGGLGGGSRKVSFIDRRGRKRMVDKVTLKRINNCYKFNARIALGSLDLGILLLEDR